MIPRVCCDPCEDKGLCSKGRNCCLECHFSFEEELALPFLPLYLQARLKWEHEQLEALGFPPDKVMAHGMWEEYVFSLYCPPEICQRIKEDHAAFDNGTLISRQDTRRPNPDPGLLRLQRVRAMNV